MLRLSLAAIFVVGLIISSSDILAQEMKEEAVVTEDSEVEPEETVQEEEVGEGVVTGIVNAINKEEKRIALKEKDGKERNFLVVEGETILWKGVEDITLADVSVGDEAEIGFYTDEKGILVASWVDLIIPEEVPAVSSPEDIPEKTEGGAR